MKNIFSHNNLTNQDVIKTSFESAWLKSASPYQNIKSSKSQHTILRQSALSGSGYAYPGLVSKIYTQEDEEDEVK